MSAEGLDPEASVCLEEELAFLKALLLLMGSFVLFSRSLLLL
jgi:hypothetical protein